MLDTDVDALLNVTVANFLVDYDADGCAGNIVDDASLAMVDFVRHAFLDSAVGFNIDDVTNSVDMISI